MSRMKDRPRIGLSLRSSSHLLQTSPDFSPGFGNVLAIAPSNTPLLWSTISTHTTALPSSVFCQSPAAEGSAAATPVASANAAAVVPSIPTNFDREIRMTFTGNDGPDGPHASPHNMVISRRHNPARIGASRGSGQGSGGGGGGAAVRKQQPLVEPADPDQDQAQPDEGEGAPDAGQAGHVDQEHLGDGEQHQGGRGKPRRFGGELDVARRVH